MRLRWSFACAAVLGGAAGACGSNDVATQPDTSVTADATDGADVDDAEVTSDASGIPAVVTKVGTGGLLLKGMVVTPDTAFAGEVLMVGNTITCVAASCSSETGASTVSVVETNGIIFPGLIDTHNHILFDVFDETDWSPTKIYTDHKAWTAEDRYKKMINAKQALNGEGGSTFDLGCELDKFGEMKGLIAGTTAIAGASNPARNCFRTIARTVDGTAAASGLDRDKIRVSTLGVPSVAVADKLCDSFALPESDPSSVDAYLIHIAEGTDPALIASEFNKLGAVTTTPNCLYTAKTTIIHGTALGDAEFTTMGASGMSLVWSPQSNVFLYGGGTDLSKTTNIPLALSKGINIAIGPDWSLGGSQNILDELRFAKKVSDTKWGGLLTNKQLAAMATKNAAKALGLSTVLGSLAKDYRADVMVIGGDATKPYDALLAARPRDVRLVTVDGFALYGDLALVSIGASSAPPAQPCETIDVCSASKFACVAVPSISTGDKIDQTYADVAAALVKGLADYDALGLSAYKFSPLTPLVKCP